MPDIRPFRGIRYDMAQVGSMSDVVAPPYDVIDSSLQSTLYDASPYNIIRLELNQEEAEDSPESNRYTRAARFLKEWLRSGVLREDPDPAYYLYSQTFEVEGKTYIRKGFLARVRLEPFGSGRIYPHEQTLSGPKADRLALFNATKYNLSPIFGLYPDDQGEVIRVAEAGIRDKTPQEATDHLGVVNQLWEILDPTTITALQGLMAPKPVFIADGHHRYETGLKFQEELEAKGELTGSDDPANFCLMMLVGNERLRPDHPANPPARSGIRPHQLRDSRRPAHSGIYHHADRAKVRKVVGTPGTSSRSVASRIRSASVPSRTVDGSSPSSGTTNGWTSSLPTIALSGGRSA